MLTDVEGYWLSVVAPTEFLQTATVGPYPPGSHIYATISLSEVDTLFSSNEPPPTFTMMAFVDSWTVYEPDGSQSGPLGGGQPFPNAIWIENCATITFWLFAERAAGTAQVNVYHWS